MDLVLPKIKPIPIKTRGKSLAHQLMIWVTSVRNWCVLEDWIFNLPDGTQIKIPVRFIFDGASVPRPFWWFLSPTGLLLIPAIIHDFAYKHGHLLLSDGSKYKEGAPREYWDDLFKDVSHYVNGFQMPGTVAWIVVRYFGRQAWDDYRNTG